ncbi:MAG TPA: hypothetical protein VFJ16_02565 [Longimicrobium sp.]|nr:hypothetical protein [Longimicrobium sp.]
MKEQGKKLMQMITVVVRGLNRLGDLVPAIESWAAATPATACATRTMTPWPPLLWTLEQGLGAAFTPQVKAAWVEAYTLLATVMKRAGAGEAGVPSTVPVHGHPAVVAA